jgi:hypothetical protein
MHAPTALSRRALLGLVAALPLAGCTGAQDPPPPPDPDDLLRAAAVEREQALLRAYDQALLALPALAPRLTAVRAEHAAHLAALTDADPPSPDPSSPPPAVAPTARSLVEAERAAGAAHAQAALEASRELAGLLAALSASELSHGVVLA